MRNDNEVLARLWKLWAMICKMVMDGKRDALMVANRLQDIVDEPDPIKQWETMYRESFGLTVDLSGVKIPEKCEGFDCLIIVVNGLTNNKVYDACLKRFPCWRYVDDLDNSVPTNERDPNRDGTYAIWVRDEVEADKVRKNKSANMVKEEKLKTETLLERMLHELGYFLETDEHLDTGNWTMCSGSRNSVGDVPNAGWNGNKFKVDWNNTDCRNDNLRPRQIITL